MTHTRIQLEQELAALEQAVVRLLAEHEDPAEFSPAFAGQADAFIASGGPADWDWADEQLEDMLRRHGAPVRGASRATLQKYLDQLDALMPDMVRRASDYESFTEGYPPREIYILDEAGALNEAWACERLRELLQKHSASVFY